MTGESGPTPGDHRRTATGAGHDPRAGDPSATGAGPERLVLDGLDHLQRAAREAIGAMRALLDLAEELVEDPAAAEQLVGAIGSLAQAAVRSGGTRVRGHPSATPSTPRDDEDGGRVQRIPVS